MDYTRNIDKIGDECAAGVSYSQVIDVDNTATVVEFISLQNVKDWGKVENSSVDDDIITALITAARKMCEDYCNTNFVARTVTAFINNLNGGAFLPYGPIGVVSSVNDIDDNVIDSTGYKITGAQFKQVQWPRFEYLKITYTGGYTILPQVFYTAVKSQVLYLYENRGEGTSVISPVAMQILNPYRRVY